MGKLYSQDTEYVPEWGINLMKGHLDFEAIGPAEFSEEKLELDKVFRSLQDYLGTMPFSEKIRVSSSWEALRQTLESRRSRHLIKRKPWS